MGKKARKEITNILKEGKHRVVLINPLSIKLGNVLYI